MAGTLAEIARHTLAGEFRRYDPRSARIVLVEAGDRVLPPYPADLSQKALEQLERLGVTVWRGKRVTGIDAQGVLLEEKDRGPAALERLESRTVVWCAGVAASPLGASLGVPLDRAGRVIVEPDLTVPGHPEIQVVGDLASVPSHKPPLPGIATTAKQMGRYAARSLLARLRGHPVPPFRYRDWGELATIGRRAAVARLPRLKLWGAPAWLLWLFAHVFFLIGFRNRLIVMIDWAWAYFSFERSARIISGR
jgi:NADH dehydrogenase